MIEIVLLPRSDSEILDLNGQDIKHILEAIWNEVELSTRSDDLPISNHVNKNLSCNCPSKERRPFYFSPSNNSNDGCIFDLDAYNDGDKNLKLEIPRIPKEVIVAYVSKKGLRFSSQDFHSFPDPLADNDKIALYLVILSELSKSKGDAKYRRIVQEYLITKRKELLSSKKVHNNDDYWFKKEGT